MPKPSVVTVDLSAKVLRISDGYIATTQLGQTRATGGRRTSAYDALCSLFAVLSGTSGDNSQIAIALEMKLSGYTMEDIALLSDGDPDAREI